MAKPKTPCKVLEPAFIGDRLYEAGEVAMAEGDVDNAPHLKPLKGKEAEKAIAAVDETLQ
jgi:hypothetical protein